MKITIDKNHLVVIENENIPQTKEYTYHVSGYMFSDFDKGIIVLHKKAWKIINLKNLSDTMSVAYIKGATNNLQLTMELDAVKQALGLFNSFDETSGESYFFVPNMSDKDVPIKNQILEKLNLSCRLKKTEKGITVDDAAVFAGTEKRLSFLFGLVLLYGKFDVKNEELASCKIQLPLFGQYLKHADILDGMIKQLQEHGMFLKSDKLQTSNGIIYQISCTDYEVLEVFAKWYESVEKFEKITKRDFTDDMKKSLLEFIKTENQIPDDGKSEVIEQIEKGILKLLTK